MAEISIIRTQPNPFKQWLRIMFFSGHLKHSLAYNNVLDLCCGWGFYLKINPNAYGVDIDSKCIKYLLEHGYKVKECDVFQGLPFSDGSFDLVLAHDALEHFTINEAELIFANVFRVLRKEGIFMIVIPNRKGYEYGIKIGSGHKHFITFEEIKEMIVRKFILVNVSYHPLPAFIGEYFTHNKKIILLKKI